MKNMTKEIRNNLIMTILSDYLNNSSDFITKEMIDSLDNYNLSISERIVLLLLGYYNIENKELTIELNEIIKELDKDKYENNDYYKNINLNNIKDKNWSFETKSYKPYELFVYNDLENINGKLYPKIGYFTSEYSYPCVLENNREWMLITPNEIETMKDSINEAYGNVLTYGLGLGYYQYMISNKENVKSITIIEKDKKIIDLFTKYILPQYKHKNKIKIINEDALKYKYNDEYDYVFVDIWHDPSDGIELYKQMKELEKPNVKYSYWIERTIKNYLD